MRWTPDVVLNTPIPQLLLAIEGCCEFARMTNPFGTPKKTPDTKKAKAKLEDIQGKARAMLEKRKQ